MTILTIGERVKKFRKHFGLTQEIFSERLGMSRGNISKIEKNMIPPSNAFLNVLKERFAGNSDWIKTGVGEMFIAPEEYITNGIKFLGVQKYGEGLAKIISDPKFPELNSLVAVGAMTKGSLDPKLATYLQYILNKWDQGDETVRGWLMIQLGIAFREVAERLQEEKND
jgi:transcriptional regulator with XRE-family HTH domain